MTGHVPRPMQEYRQFGEAAGEAMRANAEMATRHAEARAREDAVRQADDIAEETP